MKRHVISNALLATMLFAASATGIGCDDSDGTGKATLSAMIPDPVQVDLTLTTGVMTFDFSADPLDMEQQDSLMAFLFGSGIAVTVVNDATGVAHDLNEGANVTTAPDQVGEFLVSASEDGAIVTVEFYNWFEGKTIQAGGDYSATVDVLENEFFATESFFRDVTVVP